MVFVKGKRLTPEQRDRIVAVVAHQFGISADQLWGTTDSGPSGHAWSTLARHVCCYMAHTELAFSPSAIAEAFGRDRTTVEHAIERVEDMRDTPIFEVIATRIISRLDGVPT